MTRKRLPVTRKGISHSVVIGDKHKLYIQTGEYDDGQLGEVFIRLDKAGQELRVYDVLATCISIGLQSGVPLATYIHHLKGQHIEPSGVTDNPDILIATGIADYLGRWLELKYLHK